MNGGPDALIAELASGQHGVVSRPQLLEAGVTPRMVQRRLARGWLTPLHRGVYRVGPLETPRTMEMAAVLACGRGAVLSHRSAGGLWGFLPTPGRDREVEVSVERKEGGRLRGGIRVHRVTRLPEGDRTVLEGIPITTPLRTLLDLAGAASRRRTRPSGNGPGAVAEREVEQAVARAERHGLVASEELGSILCRSGGGPQPPGRTLLRRLLDSGSGPAFSRSVAEERFLDLIRSAQLPAPEVNARVGGYEVDFLWRGVGLGVEVDGFRFHSSRGHFEGDRRRDMELAVAGIHVLRVTWTQVVHEPVVLMGRVAMALGRAAAQSGRDLSGPVRSGPGERIPARRKPPGIRSEGASLQRKPPGIRWEGASPQGNGLRRSGPMGTEPGSAPRSQAQPPPLKAGTSQTPVPSVHPGADSVRQKSS